MQLENCLYLSLRDKSAIFLSFSTLRDLAFLILDQLRVHYTEYRKVAHELIVLCGYKDRHLAIRS